MPSELRRSIQTLFKLFDNDDEGCIGYTKMKEGESMRKEEGGRKEGGGREGGMK